MCVMTYGDDSSSTLMKQIAMNKKSQILNRACSSSPRLTLNWADRKSIFRCFVIRTKSICSTITDCETCWRPISMIVIVLSGGGVLDTNQRGHFRALSVWIQIPTDLLKNLRKVDSPNNCGIIDYLENRKRDSLTDTVELKHNHWLFDNMFHLTMMRARTERM